MLRHKMLRPFRFLDARSEVARTHFITRCWPGFYSTRREFFTSRSLRTVHPETAPQPEHHPERTGASDLPEDHKLLPKDQHELVTQRMSKAMRLLGGNAHGLPFSFFTLCGRLWWDGIFRTLCQGLDGDRLSSTVEEGAKQAIQYLFEKILSRDWKALEPCVDARLLKSLKNLIDELHSGDETHRIKETIQINTVLGSRLVGLRIISGGVRGASVSGKVLRHFGQMNVFHWLTTESCVKECYEAKTPRDVLRKQMELLRQATVAGCLARVDVICQLRQTVTLQTDTLLMKTTQPVRFHHLRFETVLKRATDSSRPFLWDPDWILVDFNRVLQGNYPFDPETFTDRESRAVIQSDSTTPIMACDDQDQPVLCKGDANASWNNYPAERHPDRVSQ